MKLKKDVLSNTGANESSNDSNDHSSEVDAVATRMAHVGLTFVDAEQSEIWNAPATISHLSPSNMRRKKTPNSPGQNSNPAVSEISSDSIEVSADLTQDEESDPSKTIFEEELSRQNLYKTELCRSFVETGICRYGHKCQFAHGTHEVRPVMRHPKYKTEVCKKFASTGHCPYGVRCRFIHPVVNTPIVQSAASSNTNAQVNRSQPPVVWSNSWATPGTNTGEKTMTKKALPVPIGTPVASGDANGEAGSSARRLRFFQSIA